jgi:hypothetical protein
MINYLQFYFIGLFVIVFFEYFLSQSWNSWYFRTGIPIYRKNYSLPKGMQLLAHTVEAKWGVDDWALNLTFKDIGEKEIAFREEFKYVFFGAKYTPIMRGLIRRNSAIDGVEIVGFLNWSVTGFAIVFTLASISIALCGIIFLTALASIIYICYRIQVQRFDSVGLIFDEVKEMETNR